jgi:hypothetical protein
MRKQARLLHAHFSLGEIASNLNLAVASGKRGRGGDGVSVAPSLLVGKKESKAH